MSYIDFNDNKIPIGKRKQAYVKWAISKGTEPIKAKRQANKKFGFEQKKGAFAIVIDHGRMDQRSFCTSEIFSHLDLRKYKRRDWTVEHNEEKQKVLKKKYEDMGWYVFTIMLVP